MDFNIEGNPDYGQLTVSLDRDETFVAESGAMSWMSDGMEVNSRLLGGFGKALVRKVVGGESFFVAEYSHPQRGEVTFSPSLPGSVLRRSLDGDSLLLTAGCFLGCTPGIELSTRFLGLKSFFSGEGGFFIEASGKGEVFYNAYGAVIEKEVENRYVVDTGHVVAFEPSLKFEIRGMGNLKSTLLSGEGLVIEFSGRGRLFLQSRTLSGLAGWLTPYCRAGR